jgi:uncharacterized protein (DUF302 family)
LFKFHITWAFFGNLLLRKHKNYAKRIPISVIVLKNEDNKINFIPLLAEQNYPDYEIVLIDDASSDATLDIF